MLRATYIAAVLLTALCLVPAGAHFFALPNKIDLSRDTYFIVQHTYQGWALFGAVVFAAIAANVALGFALRRAALPAWPGFAAAALVAATLVVFFIWVFPGNQATANWTAMPENWEALRTRWEYGHAASAVLTFLALGATTVAWPRRG